MKRIGFLFVLLSVLICTPRGLAKEFYDNESYSFVQEGSGAELVILKDLGDCVLASAKDDWGAAKASQAFALLNGRILYEKLPSEIINNIKSVQWDIFGNMYNGKVSVPDSVTAEKYSDILIDASKAGLNKDSVWGFYENAAFGKDTEDFEKIELNFENDCVSAGGGLLWETNAAGVRVCTLSDNEIVISFKAPKSGNYSLELDIAHTEFLDSSLIRITKCRNGYIFDGELIKAFEVNESGAEFNTSLELSQGDRVFFHFMPGAYKYIANIEFLSEETVYSLYNDINICGNRLWLSDVGGDSLKAYDLEENKTVLAGASEELYLKPVFYINKNYFKENRVDIKRTGKAVFGMIRNSFDKSDLIIYNEDEKDAIFYDGSDSFSFDESGITDKDGNKLEFGGGEAYARTSVSIDNNTNKDKDISYIIAAYTNGRLSGVECSSNSVGAYSSAYISLETEIEEDVDSLKTFLWDGDIVPLSETGGEYKNISLENTADINEFKFYKSASNEMNIDNWTLIDASANNQMSVNSGFASALFWQEDSVRVNIQNDSGNSGGKGELKAVWTAPYNSSRRLSINYRNLGTDVVGGDGGALRLDCVRSDGSVYKIRDIAVPISFKGGMEWLSVTDCINVGAGDRIVLSFNAGTDGYADNWEIKYSISEINFRGRDIFKSRALNELPDNSIKNGKTGAQIKDKTVWLAMDPTVGDTSPGHEIIDYFNSYIPNLGVIYSTSKPEQYCVGQDYFINNSIPLMAQNYGQQYTGYFNDEHAFEYTWDDIYLIPENHPHFLAGSGHAVSMPHYAFTEAFGRLIKAAADNGFSAAGYCDYVWAYCEAMGSCRNPETKKAFVEDLNRRDSGLRIKEQDGVAVYDFWDYYEYYFGTPEITPDMLGISSWEEYEPLTQAEYNMLGDDSCRYFGIQDLLVHYEFLKAAQFLFDTARDEGIEFQIMPNPEWSPDGNDFLFLNKLDGAGMVTNEYFSSPVIIDGAYQRYEYLGGGGESSWGAVMEAGGGGGGSGYYAPEIAYLLSYEIGACGAEHMECDFLFNTALDSLQDSSMAQSRDTQLLSYGMGYNAAAEDGLKRRSADFTVVSDRQTVRPLMNNYIWAWAPWDLWLRQDLSVDFQLYKMGYRFNSISQEGIKEIAEPQKLVIYSADVMTKEGFDSFLNGIESGYFENGILSAHSLKYTSEEKTDSIVDSSLNMTQMSELYPEFSYEERASAVREGVLTDSSGSAVSGNYVTMAGKTYRQKSGDEVILRLRTDSGSVNPAVVKRSRGSGKIYILLFDPSIDENYELSKEIYEYILSDMEIERQWISVEDKGSYKPGYSADLDENGRPVQQTSITDEYGAAVRLYENGSLTAAGVQNSYARHIAAYTGSEEGMVPYEINGHTEVKIKMEPNTEYSYLAFPSGTEKSSSSDADGYLTLEFDDTSYELFYIVPSSEESGLIKYKERIGIWNEAVTFGGRVERIDY